MRQHIDEIDAQIISLCKQRADVSRKIQAERLANGGTRRDLWREVTIIQRYTYALGEDGAEIATSLLKQGQRTNPYEAVTR